MDRHLFEAFIDSLTDDIADKVAQRLSLRPPAKAVDRGVIPVLTAAPEAPSAPDIPKDAEELLNTKQVAKLLGVSEGTLENWRSAGKGPKFQKLENCVRYRRSDLGLK